MPISNNRQSPKPQTEQRAISPAKANDKDERELTKLESNLRRFEEERRKFEFEKDKFEREKKKMERNRFNRLLEFERKRTLQRLERERLANEAAAAIQAAQLEMERSNIIQNYISRSKSKSRERDDEFEQQNRNNRGRSYSFDFEDDYESSTAEMTSSREGDFDMDEDFEVQSFEETEPRPPSILKHRKVSLNLQSLDVSSISSSNEPVKIEPPKQSFLSRFLFGKKKKEKNLPKPVVDIQEICKAAYDDTPLSIKRVLFLECPVIWKQLLKDYPNEWEELCLLRNKCISDFIILAIFFGAGGLVFRFIEGAFENFYKCGVRRVKRDFIDHLWHSSHNLRFFFFHLI